VLTAVDRENLLRGRTLTFLARTATVLGWARSAPLAATALDPFCRRGFNRVRAGSDPQCAGALCQLGVAVRPARRPGEERRVLNLPRRPLTLLSVVIGIVDPRLLCLAMYNLVPDEPNSGFVTLAVFSSPLRCSYRAMRREASACFGRGHVWSRCVNSDRKTVLRGPAPVFGCSTTSFHSRFRAADPRRLRNSFLLLRGKRTCRAARAASSLAPPDWEPRRKRAGQAYYSSVRAQAKNSTRITSAICTSSGMTGSRAAQ